MPLDITITLNDEDLSRFQETVDRGKLAMVDENQALQIEEKAAEMIAVIRDHDLPAFISDRILKLQILLNMIRDDEWQLNENERKSILCALYYFCDPDDVIPDSTPGIGYLDDVIYAEMVIQELRVEIRMYQEFCQFRISEENKRRAKGMDTHVGREDWIAEKRATLHARMKERRKLRRGGRGWRMGLF
ncbi:MAG: hypothetical protein DHS20C12_28450 [Pseudohongiella sp.]|nr:MAG: hypothetical protein DHS20C12_28450 [Pseudohongiella sp.]